MVHLYILFKSKFTADSFYRNRTREAHSTVSLYATGSMGDQSPVGGSDLCHVIDKDGVRRCSEGSVRATKLHDW